MWAVFTELLQNTLWKSLRFGWASVQMKRRNSNTHYGWHKRERYAHISQFSVFLDVLRCQFFSLRTDHSQKWWGGEGGGFFYLDSGDSDSPAQIAYASAFCFSFCCWQVHPVFFFFAFFFARMCPFLFGWFLYPMPSPLPHPPIASLMVRPLISRTINLRWTKKNWHFSDMRIFSLNR